MENKTDNLNPQQSLELITNMIRQTQGNVSGSSFYFLLWGWVITLCNFGMYYFLNFTEYQRYAPIVWTLCIPAWIVTMIYGSNNYHPRGLTGIQVGTFGGPQKTNCGTKDRPRATVV